MANKDSLLRTVQKMADEASPARQTIYDGLHAAIKEESWRSAVGIVNGLIESANGEDKMTYRTLLENIEDVGAA